MLRGSRVYVAEVRRKVEANVMVPFVVASYSSRRSSP